MEMGRRVFTQVSQPTCTTCHALDEARSNGQIGPDLDKLQPSEQQVVASVTNGVGVMPAQKGTLTAEQIQAVAYYVAQAASNTQ